MSDSLIAHVRTNRYGMRSDPIAEQKAPNTLRVYFLGDSITWGTTQVDQSQLFTEIVHRELPAKRHQPVEVLNGSISGWAIANELAFLKEHGTLGSDLVILVLNDGDPTQAKSPPPVGEGIPSISHHPIFGLQELWDRGLDARVGELAQKLGIRWRSAANKDPGLEVSDDSGALRNNLLLLSEMEGFVMGSNGKLSILYIPFQGLRENKAAFGRAQVGKQAVEQWAESNCVPFVDIGPSMWQYPVDKVLLRDRRHFNVLGHREIANQIIARWSDLTDATQLRASSRYDTFRSTRQCDTK